jgi:hypothetical protein
MLFARTRHVDDSGVAASAPSLDPVDDRIVGLAESV